MATEGKLANKRALVTGARQGIGRAIVERFLADGADVVGCGRSAKPDDWPGDCTWHPCDVSDPDAVNALAGTLGAIDVLVNNAGVQIEKSVVDSSDADWDAVVGANARGVFNCCRAFIPQMRAGGSVINIGSISGTVADPGMALYNASKAFVHGLTRSIAVDHGDTVRCNAICPGWILTGMADAAFAVATDPAAAKRDALARHPVGRFGQPDDVANMAAWLACDDAAFANGQLFTVDGGMTAASPLNPGLY
ncbi:MAG: SDR family oxidoreductase [Pseudomonadota bacterium]